METPTESMDMLMPGGIMDIKVDMNMYIYIPS